MKGKRKETNERGPGQVIVIILIIIMIIMIMIIIIKMFNRHIRALKKNYNVFTKFRKLQKTLLELRLQNN